MKITVYNNELSGDQAFEVVLSEQNLNDLSFLFDGTGDAHIMRQVEPQAMLHVRIESDERHYRNREDNAEHVEETQVGDPDSSDHLDTAGSESSIRWAGDADRGREDLLTHEGVWTDHPLRDTGLEPEGGFH